jgi:hypothetical protein
VVDLVGDQPHPVVRAPDRQGRQLTRFQHGSGGIGRAGHDQAVQAQVLDHPLGGLVPGVRSARQVDDLTPQRVQDVPVRGVAGPGKPDPTAHVEGGQERQQESARRAGGDDHAVGIHRQVVAVPVVPGDGVAKGLDARRLGVAEDVRVQRGVCRPADRRRRGRGWLTRGQIPDHVARVAPSGGGREHLHDVERCHPGPFRRFETAGAGGTVGAGHRTGQAVPGTCTRPSAAASAMSVR